MAKDINQWNNLRERLRYIKYVSFFYILIGIALLIISFDQLQLAIIAGLFSSSFYGVLGYICHQYDRAMCEREIRYWESLAQIDMIGAAFGRKWYSWLFYLLIVLLMMAGILIQLPLFHPIKLTAFVFGSFLSGIGTFSWIYYLSIKIISLRLQGIEKGGNMGSFL